jgi:hypothetical protein
MGTDVKGYVEISTIILSDEDYWFEVLKINIIAERNYGVFGRLFGVRAKEGVVPIAPNRGVPDSTSNPEEVYVDVESVVCHTWLTWDEIEYIVSPENLGELPGWSLIFTTMNSLSKIYGSQNVRLVVAFDNYG